jgi:hypothetical protein
MKTEILKGEKYKLEFDSGFILTGIVVDSSEHGIIFETHQKTSFINWCKIKQLTPLERGEQ